MTFQELPFLDVFKDASGGNIKTPQKEFLEEGEIPVVDQGQSLIAGFVNDRARVCKAKPPVIVFGDHTRAIKYVDFEFAMGADGTKVLVPKVESDTKYLYHALNAIEIPSAGYSRHFKFLKETQIPLPPLAEQKRIAGILDAADALRARRRESLAQLDTLLQSTFLEMFGDPVTNPMGWETVTIENAPLHIGDGNYSSKYPKASDFLSQGVPFIRANNISNNTVNANNMRFISEEQHAELKKGHLVTGDVLITTRGDVGQVAIVPSEFDDANINAQLVLLRPTNSSLSSHYLCHLLGASAMRQKIKSLETGVALKQLPIRSLKKISLPVPSLDLQHRFAGIVESVEQQKASQRAHLDELDTLFASLQSRAFNGEL